MIKEIVLLLPAPPINDAGTQRGQVRDREHDLPSGLVMVVGGVGGLDWCGIALRHVARATRLPHAIQLVPWGHGFGRWHADLTDVANRDAQARSLAKTLKCYKATQPDSPVFLVAKSGGSGVGVMALELLDEQTVERVVLLAPAMSPSYDLTSALRAVRREMVVFWSPLDVLVLGAGTRLFGTIDRVWTVGAGLVGFRCPPAQAGDAMPSREHTKLRQVRWHPRMVASGYLGGHWGPDSPLFLKKYILPLLEVERNTGS